LDFIRANVFLLSHFFFPRQSRAKKREKKRGGVRGPQEKKGKKRPERSPRIIVPGLVPLHGQKKKRPLEGRFPEKKPDSEPPPLAPPVAQEKGEKKKTCKASARPKRRGKGRRNHTVFPRRHWRKKRSFIPIP